MEESSLEWLVDSSDAVAIGEVTSAREADWRQSVADACRIARAIKDHKQLRVGQTVTGRPAFGVKGDQVMLFLRAKAGGFTVFQTVNFATTFQLRVDDGNVEEDSPKKWQKYLVVDKKGNIISSREELIRRVQERIGAGSSVPADCDREAVEKGKSVRGGFRIALSDTYQLGQKGKNLSDVYLDLLVPADLEFRQEAKKALAQPEGEHSGPFIYHRDLIRAVLRENYKGPAADKKSEPAKAAVTKETRVRVCLRQQPDAAIEFRAFDLTTGKVLPAIAVEEEPPSAEWSAYHGPQSLRKTLGDDWFACIVEVEVNSDQTAQQLDALPHVEAVFLRDKVTDAGLANLKRLTGLKRIHSCGPVLSDAGLAHIGAVAQLEDLHVQSGHALNFSDAGLGRLRGLTRLRKLELGSGDQITDRGLEQLGGLKQLQDLYLPGQRITDAGLAHLRGLRQLHYLNLHGAPITDAGLRTLGELSQLHTLGLDDARITDAGLDHLKGLGQLECLGLDRTRITDAGLGRLAPLIHLERLFLTNTDITDAGLVYLKQLTRLRSLSLQKTRITDAGLEHLKGLRQLKDLDLWDTKVTDAGVDGLRKALPNLVVSYHAEN
jgi:hypothetical protein